MLLKRRFFLFNTYPKSAESTEYYDCLSSSIKYPKNYPSTYSNTFSRNLSVKNYFPPILPKFPEKLFFPLILRFRLSLYNT